MADHPDIVRGFLRLRKSDPPPGPRPGNNLGCWLDLHQVAEYAPVGDDTDVTFIDGSSAIIYITVERFAAAMRKARRVV